MEEGTKGLFKDIEISPIKNLRGKLGESSPEESPNEMEEEGKDVEDYNFFGVEERMNLKEKRTIEKIGCKKHKYSVRESHKRGRRTINALIQIARSARGQRKLKSRRGQNPSQKG